MPLFWSYFLYEFLHFSKMLPHSKNMIKWSIFFVLNRRSRFFWIWKATLFLHLWHFPTFIQYTRIRTISLQTKAQRFLKKISCGPQRQNFKSQISQLKTGITCWLLLNYLSYTFVTYHFSKICNALWSMR